MTNTLSVNANMPKVSLRKKDSSLRSITPQHLSVECYPDGSVVESETRCFTPEHIAVEPDAPELIHQGIIETHQGAGVLVNPVKEAQGTPTDSGRFIPERTYSSAEVLLHCCERADALTEYFFGDTAVQLHITNNMLCCYKGGDRFADVKKELFSDTLNELQLLMDYVYHPSATFYGLYWLLEQKLPRVRACEKFYWALTSLLEMIERNDTSDIEALISTGYTDEIRDILEILAEFVDVTSPHLSKYFDEASRYLSNGLGILFERETEVTVHPLFLFACANLGTDVKNVDFDFFYDDESLRAEARSSLEAYGRSQPLAQRIAQPEPSSFVTATHWYSDGINWVFGALIALSIGVASSFGLMNMTGEANFPAIVFWLSGALAALSGAGLGVISHISKKFFKLREKRHNDFRLYGLGIFAARFESLRPLASKFLGMGTSSKEVNSDDEEK